MRLAFRLLASGALAASLLGLAGPAAEPAPVKYPEGITHGFLALRTLDGKYLADGDLLQTARGDQVTAHMVLRFRDGSLEDETTVFSQRGRLALVQYHLIQKGPAFPTPIEATVDVPKGTVTVHATEDGQEKVVNEHPDMPADLANGLVLYAIKNLGPGGRATLSMIAAAPKPRLVRLDISPAGEDAFAIGASTRKASKYVVRVDLRGLAGIVAPLIGKQPPDTYLWISQGDAPTFVKMEGPFYVGGPSWRLELATPSWVAP